MSNAYFSEREYGSKPRIENEIDTATWGGLVVYINGLIEFGYFGASFPEMCPDDDGGIFGTNKAMMSIAVSSEFSQVIIPLDASMLPPTLQILDFLEFCHEHVAKPIQGYFHSFFRRYHLKFDKIEGQQEYRQKVNRIFSRNGLAYELLDNGQITRLAPPVINDLLKATVFKTGDKHLDLMLETARVKFLNPDPHTRLEALEKLWDAWERIKTLDDPKDKRKSASVLIDNASSDPKFREHLTSEAKELTDIGNIFMIRHTEMNVTPITSLAQVDYLFHRMFAMIYLLLGQRIHVAAPSDETKKPFGKTITDIPF